MYFVNGRFEKLFRDNIIGGYIFVFYRLLFPRIMDSPDLEGLFQSFDDKISDVCGKLALLQHYQTKNPEECLELNNIIGNVF